MEGQHRMDETLSRIDEGVARLLRLGQEARQEWLSIAQVAAATGLSCSHVRRAVKRNELAASKKL